MPRPIKDHDGELIPWAKWSAEDSTRRDRMLNEFADATNSSQRGELLRLTRFKVGDQVRKATTKWVKDTYVAVKPRRTPDAMDGLCKVCRQRPPARKRELCFFCYETRKATHAASKNGICGQCFQRPVSARTSKRCRECIDKERQPID